jgi:hypothetical protein
MYILQLMLTVKAVKTFYFCGLSLLPKITGILYTFETTNRQESTTFEKPFLTIGISFVHN